MMAPHPDLRSDVEENPWPCVVWTLATFYAGIAVGWWVWA